MAEHQVTAQGLFVTFEGMDGSGKSTQISLCEQALQRHGLKTQVTRNPGGTEFGLELRQILLHAKSQLYPIPELLLFIADRAQHMNEVVLPFLSQGGVVLCDRHIDSTVAYQGYGRGLPLETIEELNAIAVQGRYPDITFLFDADPAQLAQRINRRGKADRMEAEALHFHEAVRGGYLTLARQHPERIRVINALDSIEAQHKQVMAIFAEHGALETITPAS